MNGMTGRTAAVAALAALTCAAIAPALGPGDLVLGSLAANGDAGDDGSYEGSISNNGRILAFYSDAENLGPADGNNFEDVFVRDLRSGEVTLISRDGAGNPGTEDSYYPTVSANGRYVLYYTSAPNLKTGAGDQVMLHDRKTGVTTEVSVAPNGDPGTGNCDLYDTRPLSANGRWAVFASESSNLVAGDGNGVRDIFLTDLRKGETIRITNGVAGEANGNSRFPSISYNGRWVVYNSAASNLVADDGNGVPDVFLYDVRKGTTTIMSQAPGGIGGNGSVDYGAPSVSNNGRLVAFTSIASNLDPDSTDANVKYDVFLRDVRAGTTKRISLGFMGQEPDNNCGSTAISPNARTVTYWTYASNMIEATDTLSYDQIVYDIRSGTSVRMVEAIGGGQPNGPSYGYFNGFSANGRWFAITSDATNATDPGVDANANTDVFVVDMR